MCLYISYILIMYRNHYKVSLYNVIPTVCSVCSTRVGNICWYYSDHRYEYHKHVSLVNWSKLSHMQIDRNSVSLLVCLIIPITAVLLGHHNPTQFKGETQNCSSYLLPSIHPLGHCTNLKPPKKLTEAASYFWLLKYPSVKYYITLIIKFRLSPIDSDTYPCLQILPWDTFPQKIGMPPDCKRCHTTQPPLYILYLIVIPL